MYVHYFLKKVSEEGMQEEDPNNAGILGRIKGYLFAYQPKPFFYNIGGFNLNLDELKHGLLRNNIRAP